MGWRDTVDWIRDNGPVTEYGPQAQYQDHSLRKHNGPSTPGRMVLDYQNGSLQQEHAEFHCHDHDVTADQSGAFQYVQILHDDGSVQIIRSGFMNIRFYPD
jgi:hypothetical protein